jgi:hypothetical protein
MARKMHTEAEVLNRLRQRSEFSYGYFLTQFGYGGRIADAVFLCARQFILTGFEVKCARGDWLNELRDPWKSYAVGKHCDYWYLVVAHADIVKPGELPDDWGLQVMTNTSTRIIKRAQKNKNVEPWNKQLFRNLLVKVQNPWDPTTKAQELREEHQKGYRRGLEHAMSKAEAEDTVVGLELKRLKEMVAGFEEASGVEITRYSERRIGEAVKLAMHLGDKHMLRMAEKRADEYEKAAIKLKELCRGVDEVKAEEPKKVGANGLPGDLESLSRVLVQGERLLLRGAQAIDTLTRMVDAEFPEASEDAMVKALKIVRPVAHLLGEQVTIGLLRRVALGIDGKEDALLCVAEANSDDG